MSRTSDDLRDFLLVLRRALLLLVCWIEDRYHLPRKSDNPDKTERA